MRPERKWQIVAGFSSVLAIVAIVVAARQDPKLPRGETAAPPADARVRKSMTDSEAALARSSGASATAADEVEVRVEEQIRAFHQRLARARQKEAIDLVAARTAHLLAPETQKRAAAAFRASLTLRYAPLYRALGLSAADIAAFEGVMVDRFWVMSDLIAAARMTGVEDARLGDLGSRELEAVDGRLQALLGPERYRTLRAYDVSADARTVAETLAVKIAHSADPLSAAQSEQLLALVASAQRVPPGADEWLKVAVFGRSSTLSPSEVDWFGIEDSQLQFLSPAQRSVMSAFLSDSRGRQAIREDILRVERELRAEQSRARGSR